MKQVIYVVLIVIAVNILLEVIKRVTKRGGTVSSSNPLPDGQSKLFWRRHYKLVPQIDTRDCGPAVLASVAKHYGSNYSIAYLRELSKTNKQGTTALGIVEAAKKLGKIVFSSSSSATQMLVSRHSSNKS